MVVEAASGYGDDIVGVWCRERRKVAKCCVFVAGTVEVVPVVVEGINNDEIKVVRSRGILDPWF